jgi:hypothetical protein
MNKLFRPSRTAAAMRRFVFCCPSLFRVESAPLQRNKCERLLPDSNLRQPGRYFACSPSLPSEAGGEGWGEEARNKNAIFAVRETALSHLEESMPQATRDPLKIATNIFYS